MNLQRGEDALASFEQAVRLDPTLVAARLNLGIALFNVNRYEEAEAIFLALTSTRPDDVRAWYNLGLIYRNTGRSPEADRAFSEAVRIDPEDPDSWYLLGLMRFNQQQYPEAVRAYDRALGIYPFHYSAEYGLFQAYLRMGGVDEAQEHNRRRERLEAGNLGSPMGQAYGEQGRYSLAFDSDSGSQQAPAAIDVRFAAFPSNLGVDFIHSRSPGGGVAGVLGAGVCALDVDMDGRTDLVFPNGGGAPVLYANPGDGPFRRVDALPELPPGGTGCAAGDFDNDGDTDLALGFGDGVRLLRNDGGRFTDVSADAGISSSGLTLGLTFIDFDHDGDLDLYAARFPNVPPGAGGALAFPEDLSVPGNRLWRNNGDGTFIDYTAETALGGLNAGISVVGTDLDNDRAIDFVTTGWARAPEIFMNPRDGAFRGFEWTLPLPAPPVGVAVFDFDKDTWMDLAFTHQGSPGVSLWRNIGGERFEPVSLPATGWDRGWGLSPVDFDNDGWIDLAALGETGDRGELRIFRNSGAAGFEDVSLKLGLGEIALREPRALITADLDGDGDVDLVLTGNGGPPVLLRNDGGNRNGWLRVTLDGLNDNQSAIGTKVEVFAGAHRQKVEIQGGSGYLGQNAFPLTAGLGHHAPVDTVRMLWPTGVIQDEILLAPNQSHTISEIDRRGSSCPVLFAWDGTHYAFITDVIGAGVVGHWVAPGQRNIPDPTEWVRVPGSGVSPLDGLLSFRLVEPMEELVYLDQVRLLAVDHPPDAEVYPHEYFAPVPPFPEFGVIASRETRLPSLAWDTWGRPVLDALRERDGLYVADLPATRFKGFAGLHTLELDLGEIDARGPIRLLMHGYVDYFSATSVFAAHQAGIEAVLPYIEALDAEGNYVRVMDDLGFPAGLVRTMARDITGRLPEGTRRIRIRTNLKVYWDQILIDTTRDEPEVRISEVPLEAAALDWLGYPKATSGTLPSDVRYDYGTISPTGPYARHSGHYTAYGDVSDLARDADDLFVIFGSGEQVSVEFDPSGLPPLEDGWTRDYFFYADGFAKDMDFYEAHSGTVGPLPFHTEEPYPYPSGAAYPDTPGHLEYLARRNTRASAGGPQPAYRFEYPE
jgi:hypothetical protein